MKCCAGNPAESSKPWQLQTKRPQRRGGGSGRKSQGQGVGPGRQGPPPQREGPRQKGGGAPGWPPSKQEGGAPDENKTREVIGRRTWKHTTPSHGDKSARIVLHTRRRTPPEDSGPNGSRLGLLRPGRLTWNLKMHLWKTISLYNSVVFRFQSCFLFPRVKCVHGRGLAQEVFHGRPKAWRPCRCRR